MSGIEPLTFWLQTRCSPNWATPPCGMFLSIPQSRYECQIYFPKIDQRGVAPHLRLFKPKLLIWATGPEDAIKYTTKTKKCQIYFTKSRRLTKSVNTKYITKFQKCQIYFATSHRIPQKMQFVKWKLDFFRETKHRRILNRDLLWELPISVATMPLLKHQYQESPP